MTGCGTGTPEVMTFSESSSGRYPSAKVFRNRAAFGQNPEEGGYQGIARVDGFSQKLVSCSSSQASPARASCRTHVARR
jgi:hypothetical protein